MNYDLGLSSSKGPLWNRADHRRAKTRFEFAVIIFIIVPPPINCQIWPPLRSWKVTKFGTQIRTCTKCDLLQRVWESAQQIGLHLLGKHLCQFVSPQKLFIIGLNSAYTLVLFQLTCCSNLCCVTGSFVELNVCTKPLLFSREALRSMMVPHL